MKENNLFVLGVVLLFSVNFVLTDFANFSNDKNLIDILQNTVYADGEPGGASFDCYTSMLPLMGGRTLECNVPCCYKKDYVPYLEIGAEGKCSGAFSDC